MTTNEMTGRALHAAAARAMGWKTWHDGPPPTDLELLAHLTKKGIVKAAMGAISCHVEFVPCIVMQSFDYMDTYPKAQGRDLREALARLVVAVAAREAKA